MPRRSIDGMRAADPDAVWILQGWPFHYKAAYWTDDRVRSLLSRVPEERLILLDLWGEHAPMWRSTGAMYGQPLAVVPRPHLRRPLRAVRRPHLAGRGSRRLPVGGGRRRAGPARGIRHHLRSPGRQRGGLRARHTGPLGSDAAHTGSRAHGSTAGSSPRTGSSSPRLREAAWELLAQTLYGPGRTRSTPSPLIARPVVAGSPLPRPSVWQASRCRMPTVRRPRTSTPRTTRRCSARWPRWRARSRTWSPCCGHGRMALTPSRTTSHSSRCTWALSPRVHRCGRWSPPRPQGTAAHTPVRSPPWRTLVLAVDAVAATRPELLVGRWIADARAVAGRAGAGPDRTGPRYRVSTPTTQLADALERDARSLISVWGEQDSGCTTTRLGIGRAR